MRFSVWTLLLPLLMACDDNGAGLVKLRPEARAVPSVLDFGDVALGHVAEGVIGIENPGGDHLRVCMTTDGCGASTTMTPVDAPFEWIPADADGEWRVAPNESKALDVSFVPTAQGAVEAQLGLAHDGKDGPLLMLTFVGNGVAPDLAFDVDHLDFGKVTVDQRRVLPIRITNRTSLDTTLELQPIEQPSIAFGFVDPLTNTDVPADTSLRFTVPASGESELSVWYQPPLEEPNQATLELTYCPNCRHAVRLEGEGVKPLIEVRPAAIDFGSHPERVAVTETFVIESVGISPVTIFNVATTPETTSEYSLAPAASLPALLATGEQMTVEVTYLGVTPSVDLGEVLVQTDAWDDPSTALDESIARVSLMAESIGPDIDALPNPLSFGTVALDVGATRVLTLANTGNRPLNIDSVAFDGAGSEITVASAPTTPVILQPAESTEVQVTFLPTRRGPQQAEIVVTSDDLDEGTLQIPLLGSGGTPSTCSLTMAPADVTFGLVERGRTVRLPVEARNAGSQPCTISAATVSGDSVFGLEVTTPISIPAQTTAALTTTFSPQAYGSYSGTLTIEVDDPAQPVLSVSLSGTSAESTIRVIPSELDFGVVPVGCRSPTRSATIYNTGGNDVTIGAVYLDPSTTGEFELTPVVTPVVVTAGASMPVQMVYHPADLGIDYGVLFIQHSESTAPIAVPLVGDGRTDPVVTETFTQLAAPQADVLFVIDNSGSMGDEQDVLGANLGQLLSIADAEGIDYQFGVTTTDVSNNGEAGRLVDNPVSMDRILTPQTPNVASVFQTQVLVGTDGDGDEAGFSAAYLALTDPLINAHNAGFLRPNAMLAVVFVSDEAEQSAPPVSFYEDFLRNIKGFFNPEMFSASAIVGTDPGGCDSETGEADYAPRYIALAQNTGGVVESICSPNWGQTLSSVALSSFGLKRRFFLGSQPIETTISVEIDGVVEAGWTYDPTANAVIFPENAVPPPGATVEITYTVACL